LIAIMLCICTWNCITLHSFQKKLEIQDYGDQKKHAIQMYFTRVSQCQLFLVISQ
jgi:hypothetical protein